MESLIRSLDFAVTALRTLFLGGAVVVGVLCAVDWGVRTRRLSPFSSLARGARRIMGPLVRPVERRVVRAGGAPASAPWWTLVAVLIIGIILLQLLEFLRGEIAHAYIAFNSGSRGVARLLVQWTFAIIYIAIFVRVIASWFRLNPFGRMVRWAHVITEPFLAPLRRVLPTFGMIDLSPLVAYLVLSWLIHPLLLRLI